MNGGWDAYATAARELDAVRSRERAATEGLEAGAAEMSADAGRLEEELQEQGRRLRNLGDELRIKVGEKDLRPKLPETAPADPPLLLRATAEAIREADALGVEANRRGLHPALLPRWGTTSRNALIYGIAAFFVLVAQAVYYERSDANPSGPVLLFILPLIGYVIGLAVAGSAARQRIRSGEPPSSSPRLGLAMVFGIAPIAFAVFVLHSFLNR